MTRAFAGLPALAVAMLTGHVFDRTTGQPLPGVHVSAGAAHAVSDTSGRFALRGLHAGTTTITLESSDVPVQHVTVTVGSGATQRDLRACSTTLDYNCGAPAIPAGGGNGAG